jgi:hypothetical protein
MSRWNGKHPIPYDFFFSFNSATGQNLDWYFKPWFFENKYPDLTLSATISGGGVDINVFNKGGLPVPVKIKIYYEDGTSEFVYEKNADEWKNGNTADKVVLQMKKKIKKIELGTTQIPDVNMKDNTVEF